MKYITEKDVSENIDVKELIEMIEDSYKNLKNYVNPPRFFSKTRDGGDYLIAAATNLKNDRYMVRGSSYSPWRKPAVMGHFMLKNYNSGELLAVIEGSEVINYRTGAKTGVAVKHLSKPNSEVLGLVGLGASARIHAEAISKVRNLKEIYGYARNPEKNKNELEYIKSVTGIKVKLVDLDTIQKKSDIIVLSTWSTETPIYTEEGFSSGQLIVTTAHYEEVSKEIVEKYKTYVDREEVAQNETGPVKLAINAGLDQKNIIGDLNKLLNSEIVGREDDDEIIYFQSLGSSHEDLVVIESVFDR